MTKTKIAVLGGGVASLAAAFELTQTPELREKYDITLYQMGWRLGGKGATGRNLDAAKGKRIEEHGLHIWLGFYDNAFSLIQKAYAEVAAKGLAPNSPFKAWSDAFKPQSFTPVGVGDGRVWAPIYWPTNHEVPGESNTPDPIEAIKSGLEILWATIRFAFSHNPLRLACILWRIWAMKRAAARLMTEKGHDNQPHLETIHGHLAQMSNRFRKIGSAPGDDGLIAKLALEMLEIGMASIRGFLNPKYGLLKDFDLNRIDEYEFLDWLVENGAPADIGALRDTGHLKAPQQPFLRALYDLAFAYKQSDAVAGEKQMVANFAAGAALRCCIRIVATYRGAVLYEMQAGMGEVAIAPLYQLLVSRGVKFEFFSKISNLRLSENGNWIDKIEIERQAQTISGAPYQPIFDVDGLACWPSEPFWDQLVGGTTLQGANVNFESHWASFPATYERPIQTLNLGTDFDKVILGISLGALKDFGNGEPSIAAELIAASPDFAAMTQNLGIVPTHAEQLWLTKSLADLGWSDPRPAMVGSVEPLDVWADMTPSLPREDWPTANPPQSLHYLCGPLNTDAYAKPPRESFVPAAALADVRARTQNWLENDAGSIWPRAVSKGTGGMDWSLLYGGTKTGPDRLADQFLRANIDPTECCPASWCGTTQYRLHPGKSGFINLVLAGDWTRTGTNTACVESAVMSGKAASRAICGSPAHIPGEHFMQSED